MSAPGAVVIGGYVNGLGIVRALASRGVRSVVITTKPYDIAHRSRWVVGSRAVQDLEERADGLVEVLDREASSWAGWALVPTNDEALAALREHGERLSSNYRIVAPSPDAIRYLLDKRLMMEAARGGRGRHAALLRAGRTGDRRARRPPLPARGEAARRPPVLRAVPVEARRRQGPQRARAMDLRDGTRADPGARHGPRPGPGQRHLRVLHLPGPGRCTGRRPAGAKAASDTSRLRRRPGGGDRGRAAGAARGDDGDRPSDGPSRDRQRGVQARLPRRPLSLPRRQRALDGLQRPASAGRPRPGRLGLARPHGRVAEPRRGPTGVACGSTSIPTCCTRRWRTVVGRWGSRSSWRHTAARRSRPSGHAETRCHSPRNGRAA